MLAWIWMVGCSPSPEGDDPAKDGPGTSPQDPLPPAIEDADADGVAANLDCDDHDPDAPAKVTVDGTRLYADLDLALSEAEAGAEIVLCGTFVGGFTAEVPVALSSLHGARLSGAGLQRVLALPGGSSIAGIAIERGRADGDGGGLLLTTPGTLVATDLEITDNSARRGGGVAVPEGGTLVLTGSTVSANRALGGGGLYVGPGGRVELVDTRVEGNTAESSGGGVHLDGGVLIGGEIVDNVAIDALYQPDPSGGGGVATTGTSTVSGAVIERNRAGGEGGGVAVFEGELTLSDTRIAENGAVRAGGLWALSAAVHLGDAAFEGNTAQELGGGIYLADATADGGTVTANRSDGWGGGVSLFESTLDGTVVRDNTAPLGAGGAWIHVSTLTGCTVEGNVTDGDGAGVFASYATLVDTTITGNVAGGRGGGVISFAGPLAVTGGTIADNAAAVGGGLFLDDGVRDPTEFRLVGVSVTGNVASERGGGAALDGVHEDDYGLFTGGSLVSDDSDWGEGAGDNLPGDVSIAEGTAEAGFGAGASFVCAATGCTAP